MAWVPLESNPEVMTKFLHKLGVPKNWGIVDVYGVDPDLLAVIPRPVLALILLYPITDKSDRFKNDREAKLKEDGQKISEDIYYMKQCVSNACGTVALIHGVANNSDKIQLEDGQLKSFLDSTKGLSPLERGELLAKSEVIIDTHKELAQEGQTEAPGDDSPVNHHFITFVEKDGSLYELDGRQSIPVNHGASTADTFLDDAVRVCREYMARDPDEVRFSMVALAANE
ncbi:ubiquitin carboxyl-terminal hydrolase isozyme L3 [Neodiprion fabricii]|uniref:ubiquitin carboxyl-terminal hydrolase isozyme L3 n=1 Tax=Neodiprion fabricii TaxID=2872261 RepID=UPI001ED8FD87|nr:ubiquitin carboxyl-terminal hydrolase isozyme L3 [Neodiprion fabricii]